MKLILISLGLTLSAPGWAKSLDAARRSAARLDQAVPNETEPLLCADCDSEWAEGGEPLRRIERLLADTAADPKLDKIMTSRELGELLTEHMKVLLSETTPRSGPAPNAKAVVCALVQAPCRLLSAVVLGEYCSAPDAH